MSARAAAASAPVARNPVAGPQAGMHWQECSVLLTVGGILVFTLCNLLGSARDAQAVDAGRCAVRIECQRLLDEMRTSMIGAIPVARSRSHAASGWCERLAFPPGAEPIAFTRLARASAATTFGREARSASRTGNAVLFARPSRRVLIRGRDQRTYRIRTYRFVCYYLTPVAGGPRPGFGGGLDLARFVSERVADAEQFAAVTAVPARAEILRVLAAGAGGHPVRWLWRRSEGPAEGILRIDSTTGATRAGVRLAADTARSSAGLLSAERFSVATNFANASIGVARLARRSAVRGGFPHGFEAQFAGPASARQMELHLTLIQRGSGGAPVSADLRAIAVVRDR